MKLPNKIPEEKHTIWNYAFFGAMRAMVSWETLGNRKSENPHLERVRMANLKQNGNTGGVILNITKVVSLIVMGGIITATFTTDELDISYFDHLDFWNLKTNDQAFLFFLRDAPFLIFLLVFSFAFSFAARRYLAVYDPRIIEKCSRFLSIARGFTHFSFALAASLFILGGHSIYATVVEVAACFMFFLASVFSTGAGTELRNVAADLYSELKAKKQDNRATRMYYIHEYRVLGSMFRGWATINLTISIFLLGFTIVLWLPNSAWSIPEARYLAVTSSTAFLFTIMIFLFVGAVRAQSREGNLRYFNAVELLNKEFGWNLESGNDGDADEAALKKMGLYHLEIDPTIERPDVDDKADRGIASKISSACMAARLPSSVAFGAICAYLSGSMVFGGSIALAMAFSFLMNDLVDFLSGKDLIGHPDRALPSGRTTVQIAIFGVIAIAIGFMISNSLLERHYWSPTAYFLGAVAYNLFLKEKFPIIATPFCALLFAFVLSQAASFGFWEGFSIWLAILAREFVLDYRDAEVDYEFNHRKNIAYIFQEKSWVVITMLVFLSSVVMFLTENYIQAMAILLSGSGLIIFAKHQFSHYERETASKRFIIAGHFIWPLLLLGS